ncbi:MAG TPA: sterol desaturase family protein [Pseudomonadales bacterium]|jgi:sterol desaturase/sphingolipid hydroxylase (fatty acid hydroxylase superfamily)
MNWIYDWQASLFVLAVVFATVAAARFVLFRIPAFARTKASNAEANRDKFRNKKGYAGRIKSSQMVSLITNLVFFIAVVPFITTFEAQSVGKVLLDLFIILMVYDFFYYLMHRFLFHGQGYFRRVHAVHHQARNPTSLDALLLHPMEAVLGIVLFMVVTTGLALIAQEPLHVATMIIAVIIYTQINTFNHVHTDLDYFPFRLLNWISHKHAIHHIDMHKGNYATITLLFDKMFGTLD